MIRYLNGFNNEVFRLVGLNVVFVIPWNHILMLSDIFGVYYVCLLDGKTSFQLPPDDYARLRAAWEIKLAGGSLQEKLFDSGPTQSPAI